MSRYRKFIAAALAAAGVIASSGLLHGTAELAVNTVIAAVGAALVVLVPNAAASARRKTHPAAHPHAGR